MFSKSLDKQHLKNAMEMKQSLAEDSLNIEDVQINTKELYENAFQFPNVAQYEHVQTQLSELQSIQDNLNQNQDNPINQDKFVRVATKVRNNFIKAYKDQWTDPAKNVWTILLQQNVPLIYSYMNDYSPYLSIIYL